MKKIKKAVTKDFDKSIINWEDYYRARAERLNRQILSFKIGHLKISFVFRHRYEKYMNETEKITMWKRWELGLWFKRNMCMSSTQKDGKVWGSDVSPEYMLGLNFLWAKMWMTLSWKVLEIHGQ